jgi:hypothetical protein
MERVHQLVAAGTLCDEDDRFWSLHWLHIASAKVPREMKHAAYRMLNYRDIATINNVYTADLYKMVLADRTSVAELDLAPATVHRYNICIIFSEDDAAALARYNEKLLEHDSRSDRSYRLRNIVRLGLTQINAPRCMRFMFQDQSFRESVMEDEMSPLVQKLAEELVQPTDWFDRPGLLLHGQSVKLIGMCVSDEGLIKAWLHIHEPFFTTYYISLSVMLARKLHALATPDQRAEIRTKSMRVLAHDRANDGCFELAWLFGLLGPSYPRIQACFRKNNVRLFPAMTFAMIVAMCDGYLKAKRQEITVSQRRFFNVVMRLPMDLQALVTLRLYGETSTVISSDTFDRAFLAII